MYFIMPTCGTHTKGNEHTLLRVGEKVKQLSWMTDWIFLLTMTCLSKRRMTPGRLFLSRKLLHTLTHWTMPIAAKDKWFAFGNHHEGKCWANPFIEPD